MLCPRCYGTGFIWAKLMTKMEDADLPISYNIKEVCKECHGNGTIHCCDGLVEND